MTTVCAGCGKILKGPPPQPGERVSHGLCSRECWDRAAEAKERERERKGNPPAPWLRNVRSALRWARENSSDIETRLIAASKRDKHRFRSILENIGLYVSKYQYYEKEGKVTLYRMLEMPEDADPISDIAWNSVGEHWSFLLSGAGVYLGSGEDNVRYYLIVAEVPFDCVDWESGFINYLNFGTNEFECTLVRGCKIWVTEIHEISEWMYKHGHSIERLDIEPFEAKV